MPKVKAAPAPVATTKKSSAVAVAAAPKKKMTAYNEFMKTELPKYKEKHSGVDHKEAFKAVAQLWKDSPKNPKRAQ
ncbi:hypothetical protein BGZ81_004532 [Podila clonocystis]|nr:hypothetical protein BGZ81_004532 [Podila clonocystis]